MRLIDLSIARMQEASAESAELKARAYAIAPWLEGEMESAQQRRGVVQFARRTR